MSESTPTPQSAEIAATPQNGTDACCCHSPNRKCPHDHEGKHVHYCLPRGLDLGGHCPDDGCAGRCWENADHHTRPDMPGAPS